MLRAVLRPYLPSVVGAVVILLGGLLPGASAVAQEEEQAETAPQVTVAAVVVEPDKPGPDTLCRLKVRLKNAGDRVASQLGFSVTVNGQELPVYANQLFYYALEPGGTTEMPLYNFWTTETSRPAPADGKLNVAVTLSEAEWMDVSVDEDGVETWKPLGPVEGLPSGASITLKLQ